MGARLLEDGSPRDLVLFALPRFEGQRIGRVTQGRGDWPPSPGTMLVERSSLAELGAVSPYDPGSPCTIEVEFTRTAALDEYTRKPGVELIGERTITSSATTWWEAWQQFFLV